MAQPAASTFNDTRPSTLHVSKSFTRMAAASSDTTQRKRASTVQSPGMTSVPSREAERKSSEASVGDVFESNEDDQSQTVDKDGSNAQVPGKIDDLPIEIRSLTERFLEGLLAKVYPAPLTADQLSDMFQDFYDRASSQIGTHIASVASKIGREQIETTPTSRKLLKGRSRTNSGAKRGDSPASNSGGEMLTSSEVTDRRKARRTLEAKRVALEETVERCVCERVYERIWKHRSTDDDARDEKLRSRTAALSVVGIGLKELHMDADPATMQARNTAEEKEDDISASLAFARTSLQLMNDEQYPLAKLEHLTAAHKGIVDTLSQYFPSTSSADEILPTLIYTLITSPPETLSVVSNLSFIQRFRGAAKIDGEAAYCLVNLEAAISFLETVDLSSLRSDELPEGPPKTPSQPQTPISEDMRPLTQQSPRPDTSPSTTNVSTRTAAGTMISPSPQSGTETSESPVRPAIPQRSISAMVQAQAMKIEAGRENLLSTADRVYESINGTLENSFKFVFGRFKDESALPKTLDDARRLMSSSSSENLGLEDDDISAQSIVSSPAASADPLRLAGDNRMLELVSGRKQLRDRSTDSTRSGGSGKRVAFAAASSSQPTSKTVLHTDPISGAASFITSINPLNRFAVPSFPRFGRGISTGSPITASPIDISEQQRGSEAPADSVVTKSTIASAEKKVLQTDGDAVDLNALEALATLRKIKPPRKKYLEADSAAELRVGEIEDLLQEYKRLAKAIGDAIAL